MHEVLGSSQNEIELESVEKALSSCCGSAFADVCKSRSHAHLNQALVTWYCCMAMCRNASSRQHKLAQQSQTIKITHMMKSMIGCCNRYWAFTIMTSGCPLPTCLESFEYFHGAPTCAKCHLLHSFMCSCPANKLTRDSAFPLHTNGSLWQHD